LKKFNGFCKLIYGGLSITFIVTTTFITIGWNTHFPLAIRHLRDDRDERDEDRWLRILGGSFSLEESSQVLTLVSALPLLLSILGSTIVLDSCPLGLVRFAVNPCGLGGIESV
jgi:hypothetical protein